MLNGISLFSGYAGIDLALSEWVKTILYCELEEYPQGILLSRMDDGSIPFAPVWNDVTTLDGTKFRGLVDIVFGGFPCQDISVAGNGAGLDGERSGLFFEFLRVLSETQAPFAFFENVPAIETRGAERVQKALAELGFTAKWLHLSAAEVGANHKRERWFCLAMANSDSAGLQAKGAKQHTAGVKQYGALHAEWWKTEPNVGRVVDGCTFRTHRIKALGNGVVPLQVKTAFEILMGLK